MKKMILLFEKIFFCSVSCNEFISVMLRKNCTVYNLLRVTSDNRYRCRVVKKRRGFTVDVHPRKHELTLRVFCTVFITTLLKVCTHLSVKTTKEDKLIE